MRCSNYCASRDGYICRGSLVIPLLSTACGQLRGVTGRPARPWLADRGLAGGEALVADVPGLAEEGLETAQPVGRPFAGARVDNPQPTMAASCFLTCAADGLVSAVPSGNRTVGTVW